MPRAGNTLPMRPARIHLGRRAARAARATGSRRGPARLSQRALLDRLLPGRVSASAPERSAGVGTGAARPALGRVKHTTWLRRGCADDPASPFHELQLDERLALGSTGIRHRNYSYLSRDGPAPDAPNWVEVFSDAQRPLWVDIGCGSGRFLLLAAARGQRGGADCGRNYLGLDVHPGLVVRANAWAAHLGLSHCVHFLRANAPLSLRVLLAAYPGPLALAAVQYPDPFAHADRCVVRPELVEQLLGVLGQDGLVFLQSDCYATALHLRGTFERCAAHVLRPCTAHHTSLPASTFGDDEILRELRTLRDCSTRAAGRWDCSLFQMPFDGDVSRLEAQVHVSSWAAAGWLHENPLGVPTEREVWQAQKRHGRVFRLMLAHRTYGTCAAPAA